MAAVKLLKISIPKTHQTGHVIAGTKGAIVGATSDMILAAFAVACICSVEHPPDGETTTKIVMMVMTVLMIEKHLLLNMRTPF
jgi:hypothetical protein